MFMVKKIAIIHLMVKALVPWPMRTNVAMGEMVVEEVDAYHLNIVR